VTLTVTRTGGSDCTVSVNYTTADGTAVAGADYTATSGTLTFGPGVLSQSFTVPILDDAISEPLEDFTVTLTNPTGGATLLAPTVETVTIVDNDVMADLSIVKSVAGAGPYFIGQNVAFNITVSNAGPSPASNVTVTDVLPAGMTFISAAPTQGSCLGTTTVTCNLGTLANAASATIVLTVRLDTPGNTSNTASVGSTDPDATTTNNSSAAPIRVENAFAIPTLSEWMLLAFAAMIVVIGVMRARA
jgi:uncharacterized repeat protein (TIGR01451 family)